MAGDWIKWTKGLASRREVVVLASMTGRDRHEIAGRLMVLWEWCDENTTEDDSDESLNVSLNIGDKPFDFLDALLGLPGLAEAMASPGVRWLDARSGGRVVFPKLARHNGTSAKTRAYEASKKARQRSRGTNVPPMSGGCPQSSGTKPGPEKRREEKKKDIKPSAGAAVVDGEAKPTTARQSKPQPDPMHKIAVAEYCERWKKMYGAEYPFAGHDAKIIQEILAFVKSDFEKLKQIFARFFDDMDNFRTVDSRHSLAKLKQHFARYLVGPFDGLIPTAPVGRPVSASGAANGHRPSTRVIAPDSDYADLDSRVIRAGPDSPPREAEGSVVAGEAPGVFDALPTDPPVDF